MYNESSPTEKLIASEEIHRIENTQRAREIAREEDFYVSRRRLQEEGLLEEQVERTKEKYAEELEDAEFLTEQDWEHLTIILLYSPELANHSVETYRLVREKIESITVGQETIAQIIQKEIGALDEFYRASLLHDIGKTMIPESVLNHIVEPGDWQTLAHCDPQHKERFQNFVKQNAKEEEEFDIISFMSDYDLNKVSTAPARSFLSPNEIAELERRGISADLTLREIRELHEERSEQILESEGLLVEALIAGQHHNYKKEPYRFPMSSQTIGIAADLSDLLHLGDVEQALVSPRSYKEAFSPIMAAYILYKDTEKGAIKNKELVALWIRHSLMQEQAEPVSEKEREKIIELQSFIREYSPNS